ncbi:MAG: SGNH/GDSL hydrolase family protein [Xanthomonadales bacterium]|nr:SGNH/GDSL hydrolase family protein [Xanthomonadales bacterium]
MGKKILQNSLLMTFGLLISLALGEAILRVVDPYPVHSATLKDASETSYETQINSLGLRDKEYILEHDTYRILALGDSFTYGLALKNASSWPKLLERELRSSGHSKVEVLNGGRPGTDTKWQLQYYEEYGHQYNPDLVLVGFLINDCTGQCSNCGAIKLKEKFEAQLQRTSDGFHSEILRVIHLTKLKREMEQETLMHYMRPYLNHSQRYQACTEAFRKLKHTVEQNGSQLIVFIYPMLYGLNDQFPFTPIHDRMLAFFGKENISAFDITSAFFGEKDTELWLHAGDSHPNKKANTIAAKRIANEISLLADLPKRQ